jgi:L-malate glycosyltransferase
MKVLVAGPVSTHELSRHLDITHQDVPPGLGGSPVTNLVSDLIETGDHVSVVSLDPRVHPGSEIVIEGPRLRVRYGPYRARHRARDGFREERSYVSEAILSESPDLVHAHWQYEFALGALATELPTLVTCHDWAPSILRQMPDAYRLVRLAMQAVTLRRARHLTAVSPPLREQVSRWARGRVELVPNSVPETYFRKTRAERSEDGDRLIAVNLGFSRRKNVSALLRAFALLRGTLRHASLTLVGPGYEPGGPAAQWATERGLTDGVAFEGAVTNSEVPRLLDEADILVHPSRWEACPMVLIEAMARGLPIVGGAQSGGVPWMLEFGKAGVLVDVSQPRDLAQAVQRLIGDAAHWGDLSEAARARAHEEFHPSSVLTKYQRCYEQVLSES